MLRQHRNIVTLALALLFALSLVLFGCSSKPDAEQLKQLNDLKEEYAALQREVASKEQAKAQAEREIADKNAKLKKCNDDKQIVKQRLGQ